MTHSQLEEKITTLESFSAKYVDLVEFCIIIILAFSIRFLQLPHHPRKLTCC